MLGRKGVNSTKEFMKELQTTNPEQPSPQRNGVDKMVWLPHDDLQPAWLLGKKKINDPLESDDENKKLAKTHAIATWPPVMIAKVI